MIRWRSVLVAVVVPMLLFLPSPAEAQPATITAVVGGGVSSQPHLAGAGDWTFNVTSMTGTISRLTVAVRLESCDGPISGFEEVRYRRGAPLTVGSTFAVEGVPAGRHCARASVAGAAGSNVELEVTHPSPPAAGTVVIVRPPQPEPFYLGSSSWPVWVSAAVVGSGDDYDAAKTAELDWYRSDTGTSTWELLATDTAEGYVSLDVGDHTLVASAAVPSAGGAQASHRIVVHQELDVVLGAVTIAGTEVSVPVTVTSDGVGMRSYLEGHVTAPGGAVRFTATVSTDENGVGEVTFKASKPGTYAIEVEAHADLSRYGHAATTFRK